MRLSKSCHKIDKNDFDAISNYPKRHPLIFQTWIRAGFVHNTMTDHHHNVIHVRHESHSPPPPPPPTGPIVPGYPSECPPPAHTHHTHHQHHTYQDYCHAPTPRWSNPPVHSDLNHHHNATLGDCLVFLALIGVVVFMWYLSGN